jgi:Tn7-like transposition protein D/TniQ
VICNFPVPYPDEILYSVFARYSDRMRYASPRATTRDLFGYDERCAKVNLPNGLGRIVANLPPGHNYTVTHLINNHTLLPCYEPFLPPGRIDLLRKAMEATDREQAVPRLISNNNATQKDCLRFCPQCVQRDRHEYGECYWHRVHQIPCVKVCPCHDICLQTCTITGLETIIIHLSAERVISENLHKPVEEPYVNSDELLKIAQDVLWLLQNHHCVSNSLEIHQRYLLLLLNCGFASFTGKIDPSRFLQAFRQQYDDDLLRYLRSELKEDLHENWAVRLPHRAENVHPLVHHLLFIHFLGHTIETFLQPPTEQKPFGTGPWPCLNPVCPHYRQRCIHECKVIYRLSQDSRPRGVFSCDCGFIYSRKGPDRSEEDHFRSSGVKVYGPLWETKLQELLENPNTSIGQAARTLGVSYFTIYRSAKNLKLSSTRIISHDQQEIRNQGTIHAVNAPNPALQGKYRALWLSFREENQRDQAQQIYSKEQIYKWLYNHDREWLQEHSLRQKQRRARKNYFAVDWQQRDVVLVNEIRSSVSRLRKAPGRPVWLNTTSILRENRLKHIIRNNLDRLPLTNQALKDSIESIELYTVRKVHWLAERYLQEGTCPSRRQFIQRGCFDRLEKQSISVRSAINDALQMLSTNTAKFPLPV